MNLRWGKRSRRLLLGLALFGCLWLLRAPLLSGMARLLIADGPPGEFDVVWVRPECDGVFDVVAGLYREAPSRRIVLVEPAPIRLVQVGLVPSFEAICRREFGARGIPQNAVTVVGRGARNGWEEARAAAEWLHAAPDARVLLLCDRFRSGAERSILNAVLGPDAAARVRILALPSRNYDETDWWRSRKGVRQFMYATLSRLYVGWAGEPKEIPERQSPEDFERMLDQLAAEVAE